MARIRAQRRSELRESRRWPGYNEARRATMLLGETSSVADAPFDEERRAWDNVPGGILGAL